MFKKPFATSQRHRLSGADHKKLKKALAKAWNATDEQIEALLPGKEGVLELAKVTAPSRAQIYYHDGDPIVVDTTGKNDYVPTPHALCRRADLVPTIVLTHHAVSQYLLKGADLMLPGVRGGAESLPPFVSGTVLAVSVAGNPCPLGVGVALMSRDDAIKASGRGRLLSMLTIYGDCLWETGTNTKPPNAGYLDGIVVSLNALGLGVDGEPLPEDWDGEMGGEEGGEGAGGTGEGDEEAGGSEGGVQGAGEVEGAIMGDEQGAMGSGAGGGEEESEGRAGGADGVGEGRGEGGEEGGGRGVRVDGAEGGGETSGRKGPEVSMEEMEELVMWSTLQALHLHVSDKDLPLAASKLWKTILASRPEGTSLDIKHTRFKKLSKWMEHLASEGILSGKQDKHAREWVVTAVNRQGEAYTRFRPVRKRQADAGPPSEEASSGTHLDIAERFRPSANAAGIFLAVGKDPSQLYAAREVHDVLMQYVQKEGLDDPELRVPSREFIFVDNALHDCLYKGVVRKGDPTPRVLRKAEIKELFLARMSRQNIVSRDGQTHVRRGQLGKVRITTERRQGNKRVTVVQGLETFLIDSVALCGSLSKLLAAATTTEEAPGAKKGAYLVVAQGDHKDRLAAHLTDVYKIPRNCIDIQKK